MMKTVRNRSVLFGALRGRQIGRSFTVTVASALLIVLLAGNSYAVDPPPRGVSLLGPVNGSVSASALSATNHINMITVGYSWAYIDENSWGDLTTEIDRICDAHKNVLLRLGTMGGSAHFGGNTPDAVFTAMGVAYDDQDAVTGTTYAFAKDGVTYCIPVFWNPAYVAAKKTFIANAGALYTNKSYLKVVAVSVANAVTEDWNVPHGTIGNPSETTRWQDAGYTTQTMIDTAIHVGDAHFTDGVVTGTTLTSSSAVFTQADVNKTIYGARYKSGTYISSWQSPTEVTISQTLNSGTANPASFTIHDRRDGLIDVTMAAFPNQDVTIAIGNDGPDLDYTAAGNDADAAEDYLAKQILDMAHAVYGDRLITQINSIKSTTPDKGMNGPVFRLLASANDNGYSTAGQAGWFVSGDETYRMNGYSNCDHSDSGCGTDNCTGSCVPTPEEILVQSADHLATYGASFYEIYKKDAGDLPDAVEAIDDLLNP